MRFMQGKNLPYQAVSQPDLIRRGTEMFTTLISWHVALAGMAIFILGGLQTACAGEQDLVRTYYEALRDRSMYVLAESAATQTLARSRLPEDARDETLLQLSITLLEHGIQEHGAGRKELWERSQQTLLNQQTIAVTHPRSQEFLSQAATQLAEQGAILAWESTLIPEDAISRNAAASTLREAVAAVHLQLQAAGGEPANSSLKLKGAARSRLHYALVACEYWLGQVAADRQEHSTRLASAASTAEAIAKIVGDDQFSAEILILRSRIARAQENEKSAAGFLETASRLALSSASRDAILSEQLRLELSAGRLQKAFDLLKVRLQQTGLPSDELRATIVQALLHAAGQAQEQKQGDRVAEYLAQARVQLQRTSGRWRFEAVTRIARFEGEQQYGSELARLLRQAESARQNHQSAEAAALYSAATRSSIQQGRPEQAVEFALSGASVLVQQRKWQETVAYLTPVLAELPTQSRSAEADLLRCYALGQLDDRNPRFVQALQEHRRKYADSPTQWDALRMLAVTEELGRRPAAAVEFYQEIPDQYASRDAVDLRVLQLLYEQLSQNPGEDSGMTDWKTIAVAASQRAIRRLEGQPENWTVEQCQILVQASQLLLLPAIQLSSLADRLLVQIQRRVASEFSDPGQTPSAEWKQLQAATNCMQILCFAWLNRLDDARQLIEQLQQASPELLLAVLAGLNEISQPLEIAQRTNLGHLQLKTIQAIERHRSELNADQQKMLELAAGLAEDAVGNSSAAIRRYQSVLEMDPQYHNVEQLLSNSLIRQGRPADLARAMELCRKMEKGMKAGSPEWIEVRIEQVEILRMQGELAAAKKLLGVTRALYPEMGNPKLKARGERAASDSMLSPR